MPSCPNQEDQPLGCPVNNLFVSNRLHHFDCGIDSAARKFFYSILKCGTDYPCTMRYQDECFCGGNSATETEFWAHLGVQCYLDFWSVLVRQLHWTLHAGRVRGEFCPSRLLVHCLFLEHDALCRVGWNVNRKIGSKTDDVSRLDWYHSSTDYLHVCPHMANSPDRCLR